MADRVVEAVRVASRDGALPVISDASSCTEGFAHIFEDRKLPFRTEDAVDFVAREVLPALGEITPLVDSLVLHPTCSSTQMGLDPALRADDLRAFFKPYESEHLEAYRVSTLANQARNKTEAVCAAIAPPVPQAGDEPVFDENEETPLLNLF